MSYRTVERPRQRLVEEGLEKALERKVHKHSRVPRLDGDQEAYLIALICSEPPEGYKRWSLRLLAKTMVELSYVDSVSSETVCLVLKRRDETLAT